mgnify:CR=1 FL=1
MEHDHSFVNGPMPRQLRNMLDRHLNKLEKRSRAIPRSLSRNIEIIALGWAAVFMLASIPAILFSPIRPVTLAQVFNLAVPYVLAGIAPLAGLRLAIRSFPNGLMTIPPAISLSSYGRWQRVSIIDARTDPAFGPSGMMASLLIGLLLNIVMRSGEFLVAVPALGNAAPLWGQSLFHLMAVDLIMMNFFYMLCFALALRAVPYFPKILLFAWGLDITLQLLIASRVGPIHDLPASVAGSLHALLFGNIQKVMISAFVWIPYLVLSDRVNITYRQRVRIAPAG